VTDILYIISHIIHTTTTTTASSRITYIYQAACGGLKSGEHRLLHRPTQRHGKLSERRSQLRLGIPSALHDIPECITEADVFAVRRLGRALASEHSDQHSRVGPYMRERSEQGEKLMRLS
jgi:hypothetical protein